MKKFLFLLILVLATCFTFLISASTNSSEKSLSVKQKISSKTVVWAYTALKFMKPIIFKQH